MDQAGQTVEAAGQDAASPRLAGGPSERLSLSKYEGLGNDFLVLLDLDGRRRVDAALARAAYVTVTWALARTGCCGPARREAVRP